LSLPPSEVAASDQEADAWYKNDGQHAEEPEKGFF
jgi:hypothetical protein